MSPKGGIFPPFFLPPLLPPSPRRRRRRRRKQGAIEQKKHLTLDQTILVDTIQNTKYTNYGQPLKFYIKLKAGVIGCYQIN